MSKSRYILFTIFALIAAILAIYIFLQKKDVNYLVFLSGDDMKMPVTEIVNNFEKETGIRVHTVFESSSMLRDYIINFKRGDLFLSGDEKNLYMVAGKGLVKDNSFVVWHVAAILVSPQYKGRIKGLDDLAKKGIRLAISNPRMSDINRFVMERVIERHSKGKEILKNVVYGSSAEDILMLYNKGNIDAIIGWDVMASTPEGKGLTKVKIENAYEVKAPLYLGLLNTSKNPALAKKLYDYFLFKGKEVFRRHGYNDER